MNIILRRLYRIILGTPTSTANQVVQLELGQKSIKTEVMIRRAILGIKITKHAITHHDLKAKVAMYTRYLAIPWWIEVNSTLERICQNLN